MGGRISNPARRAIIKTGIYTGNGVDDRNIDIGIDLASKSNPYLIIKAATAQVAMHRTEYAQGDNSMRYAESVDVANCIQAFTSTGFQVGTGSQINTNGTVYRYIAFWQEG